MTRVIDFTSALYLGMNHASSSLAPWERLTTGKPAVLEPAERSAHVARRLAALQGCEAAVVAPSTLHLAWDLFGFIARSRATLYVDRGTYSVLRWGVERAALRGTPVRMIRHHDVESLRRALRSPGHRGSAVVVCDGFCPSCGEAAPLAAFLEESDGILVVDDTQALGTRGPRGGGSIGHLARLGGRVLAVSSLAKAFGVPIAALAGARQVVDRFARESETRVHSSPASTASLHAAALALDSNETEGDALRARLQSRLALWKRGVRAVGLQTRADAFPVQTLAVDAPRELQAALARRGISTFVARGRCARAPTLNFIVRADHSPADLETATDTLRWCLARRSRAPSNASVTP